MAHGFKPASQREEQVQTLRAYRHLTPSALDALKTFTDGYLEPGDDNLKGWATTLFKLGCIDRARGRPYRYRLNQRGQNVLKLHKYSHTDDFQPGGNLRVQYIRGPHEPSNAHKRELIDTFLSGQPHFSMSGMTAAPMINFAEEAGVDYDLKVRGGTYILQRVRFPETEDEYYKLDRS